MVLTGVSSCTTLYDVLDGFRPHFSLSSVGKGITGRFVAEPQEVDWVVPSQDFVSLEDELEGSIDSVQRDFGLPLLAFQKSCALIAVGIDPDKDACLNETLRIVMKNVLSRILDKFHILVTHSLNPCSSFPVSNILLLPSVHRN